MLRKSILNLTQHDSTPEQRNQGVVEPSDKQLIRDLLTFNSIPSKEEMAEKASKLAAVAVNEKCGSAMIGGAPYFMSALEAALKEQRIKPLYAFSVRESVDVAQADGSVRKMAIFRHLGFVEV